ncbi:ribonuclease R [Aeoliella sp. ICT_H6.2]|uniref:Ribonuclease R n=1 Tax=Aeoliella straminimaris TaxID=2954799 RepID=A0A9X2FEK0_9BACT|nr:ribonuclease R [Aeoliella straminimaris]MCO6046733.1 ribonuclease R [Aeoliella straminimaris]
MDSDLRVAIFTYTNQPAYKPIKPVVIAERLGLIEEDRIKAVRRTIKKMVKAGELEYGPNHLVLPVDEDHPSRANLAPKKKPKREDTSNQIVGTFRRVSTGEGFVRPAGTQASAGRDADIHIAKKAALDAHTGDTVRIKIDKQSGYKGKPEGRVIDVVERSTSQFVGTYFERADMGLVEVDGKVFTNPIYVGDPGAKGVKPDDKVVIDMVRFPSHSRDGEAVIVQVLGGKGEPGVDTTSIIYEFGLPGEFSDEVIADAHAQADKFDESIGPDRRDLTAETIITIDPATARDFDDAISLKRIDSKFGEGFHWLLGVHIADVSHFVPPKTTLDSEAYNRATSVYLPDTVIPMLPEIISNNLASLQPGKVRYAMTCEIELSAEGVPVAVDVFKSAIKSCRRFTYEEVDEYLSVKKLVDRPLARKAEGVVDTLKPEVDTLLGDMFELAMILRARRFNAGALELSMPEVEIDLDDDGKMSGAHVEVNTESHQMIEEFMLAANIAVATKLRDEGMIFLRRVHGDPDSRKLKALTSFVRDLGFKVDSLESRFELQKLLDNVESDPRRHAVNYAVLRSMQRAIYSPEDEGHYALAADCYCHFTSPIRRYPDLTIHRLINALNEGQKPPQKMEDYFIWGDHCSEREQRATNAERELTKVKLLHYLENKIGMEMEGIITGVERFGLFVVGRDIPAEGFIHISALGDDYYKFDRDSHSITGFQAGNSYRLGDIVRVAVATVDVEARELDFRMLGHTSGGRAPTSRSSATPGKDRQGKSKGKGKGKGRKGKRKR